MTRACVVKALLLATMLVHLSCGTDDNGLDPAVAAPELIRSTATVGTTNTVILTGTVRPNGRSMVCFFEYGTTASYGQRTKDISIGSDGGEVVFRDTLRGLTSGATYHFRVVGSSSAGRLTGPDSVVTIPVLLIPPTIGVTTVIWAATNTAILASTVRPNGLSTVCSFEYGTSASYGQRTRDIDIGSSSGDVAFRDTLQGLTPGTTYHFRVIGFSSAGQQTGPDNLVTTLTTMPPPTVISSDVTTILAKSVILTATVRPNGLPTVCYVEYGTSSGYGQRTKDITIGSGIGNVQFRDTLQGLTPETTYHLRVVASSTAGLQTGSELVGTTPMEFVFPTKVGTRWNYTYSSYSSPNSYPVFGGIVTDRHASLIWTIGSTATINDSVISWIDLTGMDTVRTTHYEYGLVVSDSTHIAPLQGQWRMAHYRDQVIMNWYVTFVPSYPYDQILSRSSIESVDTLKITGFVGFGNEYFVRGVGLVRYTFAHATQTGHSSSELRLTSWSTP